VPPTREGGGMIWLPTADDPLVFASPTSFSFGYLRRGRAATRRIHLADAGGGAGSWNVTLHPSAAGGGAHPDRSTEPERPRDVERCGLPPPAAPRTPTRAASSSSPAEPTCGASPTGSTSAPAPCARAARAPARPTYHGNTKRGRSLVSCVPLPEQPSAIGIRGRLRAGAGVPLRASPPGRQRGRFAVTSRAGGVHVSPRLVRAGDGTGSPATRGFRSTSIPTRTAYGLVPAVGVFRPLAGALRPGLRHAERRSAGAFTFRFWIDDATPPSARLLTRSSRRAAAGPRARPRLGRRPAVVARQGRRPLPGILYALDRHRLARRRPPAPAATASSSASPTTRRRRTTRTMPQRRGLPNTLASSLSALSRPAGGQLAAVELVDRPECSMPCRSRKGAPCSPSSSPPSPRTSFHCDFRRAR
jgi:hypothetical protein